MSIRKLSGMLCLLVCVCATSTAGAAVRPKDAAATRAYLLAMLKQRGEGSSSPDAGVEAIDGLASKLRAECAGVLTGTPLAGPENDWSQASTELHQEISRAPFGASESLEHTTEVRFYDRVKRLRWSDRRLTKMLHDLALESVRQTGIPAPDLCGDIRFWAAHAYSAVSPGTARELHELQWASTTATIEVEPDEPFTLNPEVVVEHRLRRYEDTRDRRLAKRAFPKISAHLAPEIAKALEAFFAAAEQVYTVLGVPPHTQA